ncbi:hypothetical protein Q2T40_19750 [Winogradskyella maritima]|uniref:Adhesin n=1 Tax=Winogradskyella maritima TaxID=1517766 RepID=A0ABV8AD33_9FLAO|nr:hypothetical protein [Winogradskyella maritima]
MKYIKHIKLWGPKAFFILFFLAFSFSVFTQNTNIETLSAKDISRVSVNGYQIFKIEVKTTQKDSVVVKSLTDGEYQNDFKIHTEVRPDQTLYIELRQTPFKTIPDDKRNAHKVVAATLRIEMPEKKNLRIQSDIGLVDAKGHFANLNIELMQGSCRIKGEAQIANINTFDGDITIKTKNAVIEAQSSNGTTHVDDLGFGVALWALKSIDGDITVSRKD